MDPEHPTPRPPDHACRSLTSSSPDQGKQAASHQPREELQSVPTPELLIPPFRQSEELVTTVHQAIIEKNMDVLSHQVSCYGEAALEVTNEQGMTPLYQAVLSNWPEAALFLLCCGADVRNSERAHLCSSSTPFMRLVVNTQDTKLLADVIKRGADIRARNYMGYYCVDIYEVAARKALFDCLAETVADEGHKRPDLLKDLFFVIRVRTVYRENCDQIERFIAQRGGCHQAEMFQVFAACCCFALNPDYEQALHYWRKSAECTPRQFESEAAEEDLACGSVFADILDVKEHPLPNTVTSRADKLAIHIHALLALEKFMPEGDLLVIASTSLALHLLEESNMATAIAILWRLTTIRTLYSKEVEQVMPMLCRNLRMLIDKSEFPFLALLESMKTINNCLTSLHGKYPETDHSTSSDFEVYWKGIFQDMFLALLYAMILFYQDVVAATPEQLQIFTPHVKDFTQRFPWARCENFLHFLATGKASAHIKASVFKIIVTCSVEPFGTKHQENAPPHLLSDMNGNTLLHTMALHRNREDFVQEGVLQCFLDHGAHLCTKNYQGETVRSILVRCGVYTEGELLPSLQCLAAAAFMGNGRLRQTVGNCRPAAVRNFLLDHRAQQSQCKQHSQY